MKNKFALIFIMIVQLFFFNFCNTQDSAGKTVNWRLLKLHYENSNGEKGITTHFYNDFGVNNMARWELLDGTRYSDNYHTYDKNGNLVRKYREFSDSLTSNLIYKYENHGKLVSEFFTRSDGVNGEVHYSYDNNGKLIEADCKGLNGWFYGQISYEYNERGGKKRGIIRVKDKAAGTIEYKYDKQDNLSREYWDFPGSWNQTFKYEYEQFEPNNQMAYTSSNVFIRNTFNYKIVSENYDYNSETGGPSIYEYGEDGKLERKIYKLSDDLKTETFFEYNEKGILIKSIRNYSDGLTGVFKYEFDGNRKLLNRYFERSDGVKGNERYEYDGKGVLIKALYDNFDTWLNGTIFFESDNKGILTSGTFKGNDGFDAKIKFMNDGNKNISKIHWDFSFGKTQTYSFEYEKIPREHDQ